MGARHSALPKTSTPTLRMHSYRYMPALSLRPMNRFAKVGAEDAVPYNISRTTPDSLMSTLYSNCHLQVSVNRFVKGGAQVAALQKQVAALKAELAAARKGRAHGGFGGGGGGGLGEGPPDPGLLERVRRLELDKAQLLDRLEVSSLLSCTSMSWGNNALLCRIQHSHERPLTDLQHLVGQVGSSMRPYPNLPHLPFLRPAGRS